MVELTADELLTTTRAVRRRLDLEQPVDPALVDECLQVALQAPTGGNAQSWRFVVVTDADLRRQVGDFYRLAFEHHYVGGVTDVRAPRGDGPHDQRQGERIFDSVRHLADVMGDVPVLVIPCVSGRASDWRDTRTQAGRWGSVLPAVWSFMLAARRRGLGTAWTTMHLTYEREVAELLGIPYHEVTQAALIPVAHTVGTTFRPGRRRDLDAVVHRERWRIASEARAPRASADVGSPDG